MLYINLENDDISEFFYFCLQHEDLLDEWKKLNDFGKAEDADEDEDMEDNEL